MFVLWGLHPIQIAVHRSIFDDRQWQRSIFLVVITLPGATKSGSDSVELDSPAKYGIFEAENEA